MYELREEYLNYKPKVHQLQMQQTKKIDNKVISNRFFNSYSLHMERANDLETLCRLRKYEMTGYRNMAALPLKPFLTENLCWKVPLPQ